MHKKLVNELRLSFALRPQGPLLVKSGREAGADPTLVDMNFVRTHHATLGTTVFIPGSSLKGAIRSYCEKIGRTVGLNVCNPLDMRTSCGRRLEVYAKTHKGAEIYHELCPICRIFGHMIMASHIQFEDAYPALEDLDKVMHTEIRDGVAIDRISGAVAVGPFQIEVVTQGAFHTTLLLRNFQLWHIGLLALALRDMGEQRLPIGFGRSRGLGRVSVAFEQLAFSYPGQISGRDDRAWTDHLYGVTSLATGIDAYGYTPERPLRVPAGAVARDWGRVDVTYNDAEAITSVLAATVAPWADYVRTARGDGSDG